MNTKRDVWTDTRRAVLAARYGDADATTQAVLDAVNALPGPPVGLRALRTQARRMGLRRTAPGRRASDLWTPARIALLRELRAAGCTRGHIAEALNALRGRPIDPATIPQAAWRFCRGIEPPLLAAINARSHDTEDRHDDRHTDTGRGTAAGARAVHA